MTYYSKVFLSLLTTFAASAPCVLNAANELAIGDDSKVEANVYADVNPDDSANIALTFMRFESPNETSFPLYYSRDFGATWEQSGFNPAPPENGILRAAADPMVAFDTGGKLYMTWFHAYSAPTQPQVPKTGIFWAYSTDGGQTWSQEENPIALATENAFSGLYDEQWMAIDKSDSPDHGALYVVASDRFEGFNSDASRIVMVKKPGDSDAFATSVVRVSSERFTIARLPSVAVDRDGTVHATFFAAEDEAAGHWALWHSASRDGGATFQEACKISDIHLPGWSAGAEQENVPGIFVHPSAYIKADINSGRLMLAWCADGADQREDNGTDIYFAVSDDHGATWSAPIIVNDDTRGLVRHQFHPNAAINAGGGITIGWYDGRSAAENAEVHYYVAHSQDGGRTFTANKRLSAAATDFTTVGDNNGDYGVGRYTGLVMTGAAALAAWTDGREGEGNLNIYTATTPVDDVASGITPTAIRSNTLYMSDAAPNPCRTHTELTFRVMQPSFLRLTVTDARGKRVATLAERFYTPGVYTIAANISALAPGLYAVMLATTSGTVTKTFVVAP